MVNQSVSIIVDFLTDIKTAGETAMTWMFWKKRGKSDVCCAIGEKTIPVNSENLAGITSQPLPSSSLNSLSAGVTEKTTCRSFYTISSDCERCGACCAFFPVLFPENETDVVSGNILLVEASLPAGHSKRIMKGTEVRFPRCRALEGVVGVRVRCNIYDYRPSSCRIFNKSWQDNVGNTLCDRARIAFGLQPFSQY